MIEPTPRRKRFGQHFLQDPEYVRRILTAFAATADDVVVEIGPGGGALTDSLANAVGQLIAVEIDRDLAAWLRQRYADKGNVDIHCADALTTDYAAFGQRLRIVGNLPYNVSTPLLFHLSAARRAIHDALFMLQKEVVDRIVAPPGDKRRGRLSVMLQCHWDAESLFRVPPGAFRPPPKVDSAIVRLTPRPSAVAPGLEARFEQLVRVAFGQRRKTLRRSLRGVMSEDALRAADIDPGARPETLSVEDFARLSLQDA